MTTKPRGYSRRERQIMDVLFESGAATAAEVRERIADPPSYSAVRALLSKLKEKGHIEHFADGPRYVYRPCVPREVAQDSAVGRLVRTFFGGSTKAAVAGLLSRSERALSVDELDELEAMISDMRQRRSPEDR